MVTKISFEPKDARIRFELEYNNNGTQALVDFLNTTSPEEFQEKKKLFFLKKKAKNIANPLLFKKKQSTTPVNTYRPPSLLFDTLLVESKPIQPQLTHENTLVDQGLKNRLNQQSDLLSSQLSKQHSLSLELDILNSHKEKPLTKKSTRHIQVQTMPMEDSIIISTSPSLLLPNSSLPNLPTDYDLLKSKVQTIEKELEQEKLLNSRLEAALKDTRNQYEILTGLAYKKLKEILDEKLKWENACMQVKEKCWQEHQHQILSNLESL